MAITQLDHVNLRTANLAGMTAFYTEILGFENGDRPPFPFGGAWLYSGGQATVHLVEIPEPLETEAPRLEHFAFQASGLAAFLAQLRSHKVAYQIGVVPGWEIRQVNIFDPDGNHLHVDFDRSEDADLENYDGT